MVSGNGRLKSHRRNEARNWGETFPQRSRQCSYASSPWFVLPIRRKGHLAGEATSILFAERNTAPSSVSGLTCLVPTIKEIQITIVQLTACHGRFAWTCGSVGS
jgi:hypothetical protein